MPIPRIDITTRNFTEQLKKIDSIYNEMSVIDAKYQYFIAEVLMVRIFSLLEDSIAEIAYKIGAGARYLNSNQPRLSITAKSMAGARSNFLAFGRNSPVQNLKWTKAKFISDSVKRVIPESEPFIINVGIHSVILNEMRIVRNNLSHRTQSARRDFYSVLDRIYGSGYRVSPGQFLISKKRSSVPNLRRYIITSKVIVNDITKGY